MLEATDHVDLERLVSALRRDYSNIHVRIRELTHSVRCQHNGTTLRLHFPAINQGKAAIWEFVNVLLDHITPFALHRAQISELESQFGKIPPAEYRVKCERLYREAISLFIRAQRATNRNGEAGELILFLLTEWILKAPQLLAKVPLKTNRDMPVHGTDGIHVGYSSTKKTLCTYWGESKLYSDVNQAITKAVESIEKALKADSVQYELTLVRRNIDTVGLSPDAKSVVLSFLDPFDSEDYNNRLNATTCLIGFDFDGYSRLDVESTEEQFKLLAQKKLTELAPRISMALNSKGIKNHLMEMFLLPLPSVQELRDLFQAKIGWKDDPGSC